MLALRPNCECCDKDLPPDSAEAMICSFECTFCRDCVQLLQDVCPNCGGGFTPRPVRPAQNWKNQNHLSCHPATAQVTYHPVDLAAHASLVAQVNGRPPAAR